MDVWKYALVKIGPGSVEGPECQIFEIYDLDGDGLFETRTEEPATFQSVEDLRTALLDIDEDGINIWFYENELKIQ